MKTNKKSIRAALTACFMVLLAAFSFFVSSADKSEAKKSPDLVLAADYSGTKKEIKVYYIVKNFVGTESADFRLKYNSDQLEFSSCETVKDMSEAVFETGPNPEDKSIFNIQFITLNDVSEEDCIEGSKLIATLVFKPKNGAETASFSAYADSCNVSPNSRHVIPARANIKLELLNGSKSDITDKSLSKLVPGIKVEGVSGSSGLKGSSKSKVTIVLVLALFSAFILFGGTAIYVKRVKNGFYDRENNTDSTAEKNRRPKDTKEERAKETKRKTDESTSDSFEPEEAERKRRELLKKENEVDAHSVKPPIVNPFEDMSDYNSDKFED